MNRIISVTFHFYSSNNSTDLVSFPSTLLVDQAKGLNEMHSVIDETIEAMYEAEIQPIADDYSFPQNCNLYYEDGIQFNFNYSENPDHIDSCADRNNFDLGWAISRIVINGFTFVNSSDAINFIRYYIKSGFSIDTDFDSVDFCNYAEKYFNEFKNIA